MHPDAERIADRFIAVAATLDPDKLWEDRDLMVTTFDEMLRAELIFGGPSLYSADPSV